MRDWGEECEAGYQCNGDLQCITDLEGDNLSKCGLAKLEGEVCVEDRECIEDNNACIDNACYRQKSEGQLCEQDGHCNNGLNCVNDGTKNICWNLRGEGGYCDHHNQCQDGLGCLNRKCVKDYCDTTADCTNKVCSGHICKTGNRSNGTNCTGSTECTSGLCASGKCQPKNVGYGGSCVLNASCSSGKCSSGKCINSTNNPIGNYCIVHGECQNANCISNTCIPAIDALYSSSGANTYRYKLKFKNNHTGKYLCQDSSGQHARDNGSHNDCIWEAQNRGGHIQIQRTLNGRCFDENGPTTWCRDNSDEWSKFSYIPQSKQLLNTYGGKALLSYDSDARAPVYIGSNEVDAGGGGAWSWNMEYLGQINRIAIN